MTAGARPADDPAAVVVALRALGLGDLLTGLPAIRGLHRHLGDRLLVLATTPGVAPLAARALAGTAVVAVRELGALPVRGPVEVAVNLHGCGPQSSDLLRGLEPRQLVAYGVDGAPPWPADTHEVARWCRLVESFVGAAPGALDRRDLDIDPVAIGAPGRPDPDVTILHAGASSEARRWPVDRWIEVARSEAARGRRVLLTGSPAEAARCGAIARGAGLPGDADLAGQTDVLSLARLVATAGRVVCGDTGVAHLATALHRPSVLLFGPTSPCRWGPPPERRRHRVLWRGSLGDPAGDVVDAGLAGITVAEVLGALARS